MKNYQLRNQIKQTQANCSVNSETSENCARLCNECGSYLYSLRGLTVDEIKTFVKLYEGEVSKDIHEQMNGIIINGECPNSDPTFVTKNYTKQTRDSLDNIKRKLEITKERVKNLEELQKLIERKKS